MYTEWKFCNFTPSIILQKFREIDFWSNRYYWRLISQNIVLVREKFRFFHTVRYQLNTRHGRTTMSMSAFEENAFCDVSLPLKRFFPNLWVKKKIVNLFHVILIHLLSDIVFTKKKNRLPWLWEQISRFFKTCEENNNGSRWKIVMKFLLTKCRC